VREAQVTPSATTPHYRTGSRYPLTLKPWSWAGSSEASSSARKTISEHEAGKSKCSRCGSEKVSFVPGNVYVVTSKKS
jgi:hypothetical protein